MPRSLCRSALFLTVLAVLAIASSARAGSILTVTTPNTAPQDVYSDNELRVVDGGSIVAALGGAVHAYDSSVVRVQGGSVISSNFIAMSANSLSTVHITRGTVEGSSGLRANHTATIRIDGGSINGFDSDGFVNTSSHTAYISGGTLQGNRYGLYAYYESHTVITGGRISGGSQDICMQGSAVVEIRALAGSFTYNSNPYHFSGDSIDIPMTEGRIGGVFVNGQAFDFSFERYVGTGNNPTLRLVEVIPEPGSLALLALGGIGLLRRWH